MVSAITFDFNGTLSDDEPILCGIFQALFAERGRPLTEDEYYDHLAGLSDAAIVEGWLGADYPDVAGAVAERIRRYCALVADGSTIDERAREAVRHASASVPLAVVSGAALAEIAPVLAAAEIAGCFRTVVSADLVRQGKPHPESYHIALERLGAAPGEAVAFEDTEAGVASAKAAGMRCIAVRRTVAAERLGRADELIEAIDVGVVRRVLAEP